MAPTPNSKMPPPAPLNVAGMSGVDKFTLALTRAIDRLPADAKATVNGMFTKEALAIAIGAVAVTLAGWALSHFWGIGFVLDIIFVLGLVGMGVSAWSLASELWEAGDILRVATSEREIDAAAAHLSNAIMIAGPELFFTVLTGAAGKAARSAKTLLAAANKAGMLERHFVTFQNVAARMQRIIIVRNTNPACLKWIERGFPGKPRWIQSMKTGKTGIATADLTKASDLADIKLGRQMGHYAVDADGVARNLKGEVLDFGPGGPGWPLEPGQLIDRVTKKPYVGDYDLLDVVDPHALQSHGALEPQYYGMGITNVSNADVTEAMRQLNVGMGEQRVMHGAWAVYDDVGLAKDVTAIFPDGTAMHFSADEIRSLYVQWGRPIISKPH
jgi:hypothetical protein